MNFDRIIQELELFLLTKSKDFSNLNISEGYTSDLLSCVMSGASHGGLWITLQAHSNIVAVAALLELSAIIITEDAQPDPATIAKANSEDISLFSTPHSTFFIVGKLWEMGIRGN